MTSNPRRAKGGGWSVLALGLLVVLPLFYVLSIGPVGGLVNHGFVGETSLVLYEPVFWAADQWDPAEDALWWYLDVCGAVRVLD
jgi:hypothetical protein